MTKRIQSVAECAQALAWINRFPPIGFGSSVARKIFAAAQFNRAWIMSPIANEAAIRALVAAYRTSNSAQKTRFPIFLP